MNSTLKLKTSSDQAASPLSLLSYLPAQAYWSLTSIHPRWIHQLTAICVVVKAAMEVLEVSDFTTAKVKRLYHQNA